MEYRSDSTSLGNVQKTRQGGIIVPANLTRTGVFVYDYADGTRVRELRHPDEVFKADSMASLAHAPVTVLHPGEVTPDNWRQVSVGHVDEPKQDGKFVAANLRIQDRDTIARVDSKDLTEVSCGYRCNVVKEDGVWNGEHYDARQTDMVYNHVAIGPKDWGRAGNDVKIKLDSAQAWLAPVQITDTEPGLLLPVDTQKKMDGDKPAETPPAPAPVVKADEAEALRGQVAALKEDNARLTTELSASNAKLNDQARIDSLVAARVALVSEALPHLGAEFKVDGKSDHEVRLAVLAKLSPGTKYDGKSEGYVAGAYAQAVESAVGATRALGEVLLSTPLARQDGQVPEARDVVKDAEAEAVYRSRNAWRGDSWFKENPWKPQSLTLTLR